ncbi:PQQ-binding-like beta-propeller repeat protein [Halobacteria archaeon HArc-gm2]|nr:PQQ-binding-like beta-propeller repeat protein [Halobacteria archaeon HArc-gm2]
MSTDWSRRALLGTVATVLAGCSADSETTATATESSSTASETGTEAGEFESLRTDDPALTWAVALPEAVVTPPALDPGADRLYVGAGEHDGETPTDKRESSNGALYSLRTADGQKEWRTATPGRIAAQPLVHDERIHAVAGIGGPLEPSIGEPEIVAYGADGEQLWTAAPGGPELSLLGADGGRVFGGSRDDQLVGTENRSLFALGDDGAVVWERDASDAMGGAVAGAHLLHWDGTEELAAYSLETGTEAWQVSEAPILTSSENPELRSALDPVVFDGLCFTKSSEAADGSQALVARSVADGSERWRYEPPDGDTFRPTGVATSTGVADGHHEDPSIVGTGDDGTVFSLSDDGTERWTTTVGGVRRGSPLVGDQIYIHGNETIYALDPTEGTERWRASVPGNGTLRLLSNGVVAFSNRENDSVVASFRSDGSERWRYETSKDLTQPAVHGNRVYVGTADGTVLAFAAE